MNRCAGLAFMKNETSDQPKTISMKTVKTHLTNETMEKTELFRYLFQIQIELKDYSDEEFSKYNQEVKDLISSIDQLMDLIIQDSL